MTWTDTYIHTNTDKAALDHIIKVGIVALLRQLIVEVSNIEKRDTMVQSHLISRNRSRIKNNTKELTTTTTTPTDPPQPLHVKLIYVNTKQQNEID